MVGLTREFIARVCSLGRVDGSDGEDTGLVLVSCDRAGGPGGVAWVCPEAEAPSVGSVVRASVEVVA